MYRELLRERFYNNTGFYPSDAYLDQMIEEYQPAPQLEYRTKVTLADAVEGFVHEADAHNYGVVQSIRQDHWVTLIAYPDSVKSPYLSRRLEDTNAFIDRLLQG